MSRRKEFASLFFASALFMSLAVMQAMGPSTAKIYVDRYPPVGNGYIYEPTWGVGTKFNVTVLVSNIDGMYGYQFYLRWYGAVLKCNNGWAEDPGPTVYTSRPSAYEESQTGYVMNPSNAYDANYFSYANFTVPTYMGPEELYVNGFVEDAGKTGWTKHGTSPWLDALDASNVTTSTGNAQIGDFTFQDPGYTSYPSSLSVSVQLYSNTDGDDDIGVYINDGSAWTYAGGIDASQDLSWRSLDVSSILDTKQKITDAKLYLKKITVGGVAENVTVDAARLVISLPGNQFFKPKTLSAPLSNHIMWVTLKLNYSVASLNNGQYRMSYRVSGQERTLQDWSTSNMLPAVQTWERIAEPVDDIWDWTDVSNIQLVFETNRQAYSAGGEFRVYEAWAEITYASRPYLNFFQNVPGHYGEYGMYFSRSIWNTPDPKGRDDYVLVANTRQAAPAGMTGSGLLAIIELQVLSIGRSGLLLFDAIPADIFNDPIPVSVGHGNFMNVSWHDLGEPGDVDGDHDVDVADLLIIAKAMGTDPSYPSGTGWNQWNPAADLNGDDKVNIFDMSLSASWYGSHYP